jgi:hypothetical protein
MSELVSVQEIGRKIRAVVTAPTDDFSSLVEVAGLDPKRDLRFHDWSGVSFANQDLRGFDFTGARLVGCNFENARIEGARFDRAVLDVTPGSQRPDILAVRDWGAFLSRWRAPSEVSDGHLRPGMVFQDAPFAPRMIVHPPIQTDNDTGWEPYGAGSSRAVSDGGPISLAVSETPVNDHDLKTFLDWSLAGSFDQATFAFSEDQGSDTDALTHRAHVIEYVNWLRKTTGLAYRLLDMRELELLGISCEDAKNGEWCIGAATGSQEAPDKCLDGMPIVLSMSRAGLDGAPVRKRLFQLTRDEVLAAWHTARFRVARELTTW